MLRTILNLPNGRLIVEDMDETYKYVYEEVRENHWVKKRRWEPHEKPVEGGKPHIHYYDEFGFSNRLQIKFSSRYNLRRVLGEIKRDFDASIEVEAAILWTGKGD